MKPTPQTCSWYQCQMLRPPIYKKYGGRDGNYDDMLKMRGLRCIPVLEVGNGYFGYWALFWHYNGLLYAYICAGINWHAGKNSRRWEPSHLSLLFCSIKYVERLVSNSGVWLSYVLVLSRLTLQTFSMDQQQTDDATNAAWGCSYAEICNVSESTCGNERHFYACFWLKRGIQRPNLTFEANTNNTECRGDYDRSIVPLIVLARRVVAEKWP